MANSIAVARAMNMHPDMHRFVTRQSGSLSDNAAAFFQVDAYMNELAKKKEKRFKAQSICIAHVFPNVTVVGDDAATGRAATHAPA